MGWTSPTAARTLRNLPHETGRKIPAASS